MSDKRLRALIADDEFAMQKLIARALGEQGFHCDWAADGNEAERMIQADHYDVVVLDLKMPNKHGHALATYLLAQDDRPAIVVHTGLIEPRLAKDLLARGVDDVLFKPFDFGLLAAKVRAIVHRRSADRPPTARGPDAAEGHVKTVREAWMRG